MVTSNLIWPINIDQNNIFTIKSKWHIWVAIGLIAITFSVYIYYYYILYYTYDMIYYNMNDLYRYMIYLNIDYVFLKKNIIEYNTYMYYILLFNPFNIILNNLFLISLKNSISWNYSWYIYIYQLLYVKTPFIVFWNNYNLDFLKYFKIVFEILDWKRTPAYTFVYSYKFTIQYFGPIKAPFWLNFVLPQDRLRLWFLDLMRPFFYWFFLYIYYKFYLNSYLFNVVLGYNNTILDNEFIFFLKNYFVLINWFFLNNELYSFVTVKNDTTLLNYWFIFPKRVSLFYYFNYFKSALAIYLPYFDFSYIYRIFMNNFPVYFTDNIFNQYVYVVVADCFKIWDIIYYYFFQYLFIKAKFALTLVNLFNINVIFVDYISIFIVDSVNIFRELLLLFDYSYKRNLIDFYNMIIYIFNKKIFSIKVSYFYGAWKIRYYGYMLIIFCFWLYLTICIFRYIKEIFFKDFWVTLLLWSDPKRMWSIFQVNKDLDLDYISSTEIFNKHLYQDFYGLILRIVIFSNFLILLGIYLYISMLFIDSYGLYWYLPYIYYIIPYIKYLIYFYILYVLVNYMFKLLKFFKSIPLLKLISIFDGVNNKSILFSLDNSRVNTWWKFGQYSNFDSSISNTSFLFNKKYKINTTSDYFYLNKKFSYDTNTLKFISYKYIKRNLYYLYYDLHNTK